MKRRVLFVHGGGEGADERLAASLRDALGSGYDVRSPRMPDEEDPEYEAWRDKIASELAETDDEVLLVGHSLGAIVIVKWRDYLAHYYLRRYMDAVPLPSLISGEFSIAPSAENAIAQLRELRQYVEAVSERFLEWWDEQPVVD